MDKKTQVSLVYVLLFFSSFSCTTKSQGDDTKNRDSSTEADSETTVIEPVPIVSGTMVSVHGRLQVQGNRIVDKNNDVIQLRGMSLFWSQWMGQYYTPKVVAWLKKDWQVTVVRAAMGVEDFDGYLTNPEIEKQKVFTVIDAAIEQGIYVIVDWHSHHAEDHLEEAKTFFTEVAQKYGDQPNIIYELYNEPLDVSWNTVLKQYLEAVLAEIRQYDSDNLVICGTSNWSQDIDDVVGNEIADKNIAYTLHYYAATHKQELRDKAQIALDNNIPIFVTEYGTTDYSGDGFIDVEETTTWWQFLDDNDISWCNWSVADKQENSAILEPNASPLGQWPDGDLTTSGLLVREELRNKNPKFE